MEDIKSLFSIDTGKILAKLHLGSLQATTKKPEYVINTGILNPDKNAKPESNNKVSFDLKNKTGTYEVGIFEKITYCLGIKPELDNKLKELKEKNKEKEIEKREEEIKKINEKHKDDFENKIKKAEHNIFIALKKYFENFLGKENAAKLNEKSIVKIYLSPEVKDATNPADYRKLIKDFKIAQITEDELEKFELKSKDQLLKNKNNEKDLETTINICWKASYKIIMDK